MACIFCDKPCVFSASPCGLRNETDFAFPGVFHQSAEVCVHFFNPFALFHADCVYLHDIYNVFTKHHITKIK